jgi:hypothetical protein
MRLGLGATLTTLYLQFEKEAEAALGLPPGVHSYALLPIGYPMGRFGPVRRVPLADVVSEDRCGQTCRDLWHGVERKPVVMKLDKNVKLAHLMYGHGSKFKCSLSGRFNPKKYPMHPHSNL